MTTKDLRVALRNRACRTFWHAYGFNLHPRQRYGFNALNEPRQRSRRINELRPVFRQRYGFKTARLWVLSHELEDVLFTDAMDIVAIPIVPVCALQAVLQPAVLDPLCNLVVILP